MRFSCTMLLVVLTVSCSRQQSGSFSAFVDSYFDSYFAHSPTAGTYSGLHQYDNDLEDLSADHMRARIGTLQRQREQLSGLMRGNLSEPERIDAEILRGQIQAELLELSELQTWRKNPMNYVGLPGSAVDSLMKRDYAPASERLSSLTRRLQRVPQVLIAMRQNVINPPREFTDLAIRMASGSFGFFEKDVKEWAQQAAGADQTKLDAFNKANRTAVQAMREGADWLQADLLPRSNGAYAIGASAFARKLEYEEMVDTPLDRLLAIGEANLEKDYNAFVETAKRIDPSKKPAEVMAMLETEHPAESDLVPFAQRTLAGLQKFLTDKQIISLPSDRLPNVMFTPPYARSGSFASMETPGAYETKATAAYYYVTPPESDWSPQHKEEHLRLFNRPVVDVVSIHEVFPGHYTQFLYAPQFPTKTRKIISCGTNAEGWAHYTEQMMIEQGFGNGDPKLQLAQLSEALLRDSRYVAGIKLHTQGWTVERAAKLFVERGFQQPANGYEEARRGAYNPTYLYYTLGKLQIYKLRKDYEKSKGAAFSLRQFHDEFVKQGSLPISVMRRLMLPGDRSPVLD